MVKIGKKTRRKVKHRDNFRKKTRVKRRKKQCGGGKGRTRS